MVPALVLTSVMGAVLGSFLNVVAWRLPRGESLVSPGSQCPSCAVAIKPYDNVPVFGWLWLRGHCRACDAPISARYPVVEAVTAVLYAGVVAARWHDVAQIALGIALVTLLVPMVLIDLEHRLIPNRLTLPFAVLALALGVVLDPGLVPEQLLAGTAAGGFFLVAALAYPRGMGMGDVKLAGVLAGAVIIARKGAADGRKTAVPFGPFLALGALVAVFCGQAIVDAYLERF